jgi:hypothetical protein
MIGSTSAFPWSVLNKFDTGMTIRQYFVAQAMAGLAAKGVASDIDELSIKAQQIADACLEREAETREKTS